MQLIRALGLAGALILSAVAGGTLIGSAFALDETEPGTDATRAAYCEIFMDSLASELGVTRDALVAAGQSAANAALDAAVEAGDVDEERAAELRDRIAEHDGSRCGQLGFGFARGFGHGMARGLVIGDVLEAAADALGIESSELIDELREAESLQALVEARGVSYDDVRSAILAAVQADLDAAVAEGLDPERADAALARVSAWLDDGGQLPRFGYGPFGGRFGPEEWRPDFEQPGS